MRFHSFIRATGNIVLALLLLLSVNLTCKAEDRKAMGPSKNPVNETYESEEPGATLNISAIPRDIDGKSINDRKDIFGKIKIISFKMVHEIPSEKYREEFVRFYKQSHIVGMAKVEDKKNEKPRKITNSLIIGENTGKTYDDELVNLLKAVNFLKIEGTIRNGQNRRFKEHTIFTLKYRYQDKTCSKTVEVFDMYKLLANRPDNNMFKLKMLFLYIGKEEYSILWEGRKNPSFWNLHD